MPDNRTVMSIAVVVLPAFIVSALSALALYGTTSKGFVIFLMSFVITTALVVIKDIIVSIVAKRRMNNKKDN